MPLVGDALHKSGDRVPTRKVSFYLTKYLLTRVGARISKGMVHNLSAATSYLEVGRWLREHRMEPPRRWRSREQLFDVIAQDVADRQALYLEFGVFHGESMRYWSRLLRNPQSRLHGFDSFEGLPTGFNLLVRKGQVSTRGQIPQIDDPRVKFFQGWFQDTLPKYIAPPHEVLVINIDCDVYSSTAYVLDCLTSLMAPGTYLYFDEFADEDHELLAFEEFTEKNKNMRFELLGATRTLSQVAFRVDGPKAAPNSANGAGGGLLA